MSPTAGLLCTWEDYEWWMQHDLDKGHLNEEQKSYFETHAVWLCARREDVGKRNGRKLAHLAEDEKRLVHQLYTEHSSKSVKKLASPSAAKSGQERHVVTLTSSYNIESSTLLGQRRLHDQPQPP